MPSWGLKDSLDITGTVEVFSTSNLVLGSNTIFTEEVMGGDYIVILDHKYQVHSVLADNALYLTSNAAVSDDGVTAIVQQGPKYISNVALSENTYSIQRIYGVDLEESQAPDSQARNIKQPGWYHSIEYTDGYGNQRYKNEVLVSLSKSFTAEEAGDLDDDELPDSFITFLVQPQDMFATGNGNATVFVNAVSSNANAALSYIWAENDGNGFTVISGGVYEDYTTNTLFISNVFGLDGYEYLVTVVASDGPEANSQVATLTVV